MLRHLPSALVKSGRGKHLLDPTCWRTVGRGWDHRDDGFRTFVWNAIISCRKT
jgi:hypothetical protein